MKFFPTRLNALLIRWFGCGSIPIAPGTAGSVGALPLCWASMNYFDSITGAATAIGFTAIAILAAGQDQAESDTRDPSYVVIDEVAGMLWATWLVPYSPLALALCFGFFRIFDVLKPFPASRFDRASKTAQHPLSRGAYIVLDDVVAGIAASLIVQLLVYYGAIH